jgi:hypothetical protein
LIKHCILSALYGMKEIINENHVRLFAFLFLKAYLFHF